MLNATTTRRHWIWIGVFVLWAVGLSGIPHDLGRKLGLSFLRAPGLVQYLRLQAQVSQSERDLQAVRDAAAAALQWNRALESDPKAQEREARRILGWVAPDEIVFEF